MKTRNRSAVHAAAALSVACMPLLLTPGQVRATDFIIVTGGLTTAQYNQFIAASGLPANSNTQPTYITTTTTGATINGTPIRFGGITNQRATFDVAGDFNLLSTDRMFLIGSNVAMLDVGNNANIAAGALITAQAWGTLGGAGGGSGGTGGVIADNQPAVYPGLSQAQVFSANQGQPGANGYPGSGTTLEQFRAGTLLPQPGANGGAGIGGRSLVGTSMPADNSLLNPLAFAKGGVGGVGGTAGSVSTLPNVIGGTGGTGQDGKDGVAGQNGFAGVNGNNAGSITFPGQQVLTSGAGGGGGQSGGQGLGGGSGGNGGQGGGGGATNGGENGSAPGSSGGAGGYGGLGGYGGNGGTGGNGGAGGGGVEILVRGSLYQAGQMNASGASGTAGSPAVGPAIGTGSPFGSPGEAGAAADPAVNEGSFTPLYGGTGGPGGNGGKGGAGGVGGQGGAGGIGGGGSVELSAANFTQVATASYVLNGAGGGVMARNGFNSSSPADGVDDYAAGPNLYRSYYVPQSTGPILFPVLQIPAANTPNLTSLVGGPAAYGILARSTGAPYLTGEIALGLTTHPSNTAIVIDRRAADGTNFRHDNYVGYDMISIVNVAGRNLSSPEFAAVTAGDNNQTSGVAVPLITTGYLNDPNFTPGATGPASLGLLGDSQTYATLVEATSGGSAKAYTITASYAPYVNQRTYTGTIVDGQTFDLPDTGLARIVRTSNATPIATLDFVNTTVSSNVTYVRAGVRHTENITVDNPGSNISLLSGQIAVTGNSTATFTNLASTSPAVSALLQDVTLQRGETKATAVTVTTDAGTANLNLSTVGVGPSFNVTATGADGTSGTTLYLGQVVVGGSSEGEAIVRNLDLNDLLKDVPVAYQSLANMNVLADTLTGDGNFTLENDAITTYTPGGAVGLYVRFSPDRTGPFSADVAFQTDVDAPLGQAGDIYHLTLTGTGIIPEPASCVTLLLFAGGSLLRRRTRAASARKVC